MMFLAFDPQYFFELSRQLIDDLKKRQDIGYRSAHLISKKKLEETGITFPIEKDEKGKIHEMGNKK